VDQQEIMTMPSAKKKANNLAPATMQKELQHVASLAVYEKMTGAGDMKKIQQEKYLYNHFHGINGGDDELSYCDLLMKGLFQFEGLWDKVDDDVVHRYCGR
jgi:predicted protein tyrosine phosphatase